MSEKYGRLDGRTWHELIGIVVQLEAELVEAEKDSKRLNRLEKAEWFVLETLSDGKKRLKILIHKDAAVYFPKDGSITVRELLDNEAKVFEVLEEQP
jgi:hypothetical protein